MDPRPGATMGVCDGAAPSPRTRAAFFCPQEIRWQVTGIAGRTHKHESSRAGTAWAAQSRPPRRFVRCGRLSPRTGHEPAVRGGLWGQNARSRPGRRCGPWGTVCGSRDYLVAGRSESLARAGSHHAGPYSLRATALITGPPARSSPDPHAVKPHFEHVRPSVKLQPCPS